MKPRRPPRLHLARLVVLLSVTTGALASDADSHRAFFDRELAAVMEQHAVPGIAAVLVERDRTVFTAGYGFANLDRRVPMDAEHTVFPLGSISKLLTTIAVLQLAESGAVDLHANIDAYLGAPSLDRRFTQPITLHHLLTHTDGFDVRWLVGGAARVPEKVLPLSAIAARLPARMLPPGELYVYSDVGITLAGYIVERVARQPFADYVNQRIFRPLGMHATTFSPNREFYARDRATGYDWDRRGNFRAMPIVYPHANPASGLTAPVADMAPLLKALLHSTHGENNVLLTAASTQAMWQKQFAHHPSFASTGYGFYEFIHEGRRALVHGGMLPGFTAVLVMIPETQIGLCIAANRFDLINALENDLLIKIVERFAPPPQRSLPPQPVSALASAPPAPGLNGLYRCDQYSRFSIDKIFVLAGLANEIHVEAQDDGSLLFQPHGTRWLPIEPLVYQRENSDERVRFQIDDDGRGTRILGSVQFMSYHRVGFWDDYERHIPIAAALVLLACVGGVLAGWRTALWFGFRGANCSVAVHSQRALALFVPASVLCLFAGLAWVLRDLDFMSAAFGEPRAFALLRLVPLATTGAALALLFTALSCVRHDALHRTEAAIYAFSAVAALSLLPLFVHWQLVRLPAPLVAYVVRCLSPSVS
jgi:Beta-lactamase class C and other penicillin binding proteins